MGVNKWLCSRCCFFFAAHPNYRSSGQSINQSSSQSINQTIKKPIPWTVQYYSIVYAVVNRGLPTKRLSQCQPSWASCIHEAALLVRAADALHMLLYKWNTEQKSFSSNMELGRYRASRLSKPSQTPLRQAREFVRNGPLLPSHQECLWIILFE